MKVELSYEEALVLLEASNKHLLSQGLLGDGDSSIETASGKLEQALLAE